jgi:hypothetical protein
MGRGRPRKNFKYPICPTCPKDLTRFKPQQRRDHISACCFEQAKKREQAPIVNSFLSCSRVPETQPSFIKEARIFGFTIPVDINVAPHIPEKPATEKDNFLTEAICKPNIRKTARIGDWVVASLSKRIHSMNDCVRYIWRVTNIEDISEYYTSHGGKRKDQIYRMNDGDIQHKNESVIHNGVDKKKQQEKDLNTKAKVLLSTEFCAIDPSTSVFLPQSLRGRDKKKSAFKTGVGHKGPTAITIAQQKELYLFMKRNSPKQ